MKTHEQIVKTLIRRPAVQVEVERIEREEGKLLDALLKARHEAGLSQVPIPSWRHYSGGASICSMTTTEFQQAALDLPKQQRAQLAHLLLESLDQPSEANIEQLWLFEAGRRAAEIDRGEVQLVTAQELEVQIQALYK